MLVRALLRQHLGVTGRLLLWVVEVRGHRGAGRKQPKCCKVTAAKAGWCANRRPGVMFLW